MIPSSTDQQAIRDELAHLKEHSSHQEFQIGLQAAMDAIREKRLSPYSYLEEDDKTDTWHGCFFGHYFHALGARDEDEVVKQLEPLRIVLEGADYKHLCIEEFLMDANVSSLVPEESPELSWFYYDVLKPLLGE